MKQTLYIGTKYKVTATPSESYNCESVIITKNSGEKIVYTPNDQEHKLDVKNGVGYCNFVMEQGIEAINASFSNSAEGESVNIGEQTENGTITVEESNE